jgi:hypothetical protein
MRPRGLCYFCYFDPKIRKRYPRLDSIFARRGSSVEGGKGIVPARAPTTALPGSEEKIRVMQERAAAGQTIFHPGDARLPKRGE